jgi:hypothetical protein
VFDLTQTHTQPADDTQPWTDTLVNLSTGEQVAILTVRHYTTLIELHCTVLHYDGLY